MTATPQKLMPTEEVPDRLFASTSHDPGDVALLNYLLQDLRVLMRRHRKGEIAITPYESFTWEVDGLERRTVLCDPVGVQREGDVKIVGFFGDRRQRHVEGAVDSSEVDLISEFENYPGILSYSSIELVDHYWANLVVRRHSSDREVHNGCIPSGVLGSGTVVLESTKYWDYDSGDGWPAERRMPEGVWETIDAGEPSQSHGG